MLLAQLSVDNPNKLYFVDIRPTVEIIFKSPKSPITGTKSEFLAALHLIRLEGTSIYKDLVQSCLREFLFTVG